MRSCVRPFAIRRDSDGAVLRIPDEIHVSQPIAARYKHTLNIVVAMNAAEANTEGDTSDVVALSRTGSPSKMARASSIREIPPPRRLLWKCNPHIQGLLAASGDRLKRQEQHLIISTNDSF